MCWEDGKLRFFDPGTESYIRSHEEDATRAKVERTARLAAQARTGTVEARAENAESRVAELEAELRRLRGE